MSNARRSGVAGGGADDRDVEDPDPPPLRDRARYAAAIAASCLRRPLSIARLGSERTFSRRAITSCHSQGLAGSSGRGSSIARASPSAVSAVVTVEPAAAINAGVPYLSLIHISEPT